MKYLLDTNIWSYLQQQDAKIVAHIQHLPEAEFCMSVVTQAELLSGVAVVRSETRKKRLFELYQQTIKGVTTILPIDADVVPHYTEIYAQLRQKGRPIPTNDLWIAATAMAYGLILVSNDKHFRYIDGLSSEHWMEN